MRRTLEEPRHAVTTICQQLQKDLKLIPALFIFVFLCGVSITTAQATDAYKVLKTIAVDGEGKWDHVAIDSAARRAYVAVGSQVVVLDVDHGNVVGRISDTPGVHGIALVPELKRAFVSVGGADHVAIVDTKTLQKLSVVATGKGPDAIIYDPATQRVFVNNGAGNSTTVIDAKSGRVIQTIDLGGAPEFAVADRKGHVFINLEQENETLEIDSRALKIEARWELVSCKAPTSVAMDRNTQRLFIGCRNHFMAVLDVRTGKEIAALPIGDHVDSTVFDPELRLIFCSNGDGTLNIFHEDSPDRYQSVQTVVTEPGAKTMDLDPSTHHLLLPTAEFDSYAPLQPGNKPKIKAGTFHLI